MSKDDPTTDPVSRGSTSTVRADSAKIIRFLHRRAWAPDRRLERRPRGDHFGQLGVLPEEAAGMGPEKPIGPAPDPARRA